jgi:hypothetical protein
MTHHVSRHSLLGSREGFAELAPKNLARWRARDDVYELNLAGLLVPGKTIGDKVAELFGEHVRWHKAFTQNDKGAGDFSRLEVTLRDYPAVADGGMFE